MIDVRTTTIGRGTSLFGRPTQGRWTFFGASSLPTDPLLGRTRSAAGDG
jgi:hypothetical protein